MSLDHPNIIPECYVDTNLIQYLLNATVNHQHSCNNVVRVLKNIFSNRFAIGIIDNDKHRVSYLDECDEIAASEHLCILKHRTLPHFMITISPAMDAFLLDCAVEQGVKPEDFHLPAELKDFINQTKRTTSSTDSNIRKLIKAINGNKEIVSLKMTLQYLQKNTYQSKSKEIKAFFQPPNSTSINTSQT